MQTNWYYGENGGVSGPVAAEEIIERIRQSPGKSLLVWTEGMAEWADARQVPEFYAACAAGEAPASAPARFPARLRKELIDYAIVSAYLYVCFGALILYKATILRSEGLEFAPFGLALVKALITGKFVLLLQAFKIGDKRISAGTALAAILLKSLIFAVLLIALTLVEEMIVGYFHGKAAREVMSEIAGGTLPQALAVSLILFLILIPYFAFRGIAARMGEGALLKLLTERDSAGARQASRD
jgi:hypothetical protein